MHSPGLRVYSLGVHSLAVYNLGVYSLGVYGPVIDFVPASAFTGMRVYSLGVYSMGGQPIHRPCFSLCIHLDWESTVQEFTAWESTGWQSTAQSPILCQRVHSPGLGVYSLGVYGL